MRTVIFTIIILITIILVVVGMTLGLVAVLTEINIQMGPYECVDIDNNILECEQTWRSHGTLYGITKDGKTVNLKSYKSIKED